MIIIDLDGKRHVFDNLVDVSGKEDLSDDFATWLKETYPDGWE